MAKKPLRPRNPNLDALIEKPSGDLWLPSLARNELDGHAYRYTVVLPLLSGAGDELFSFRHDIPDLIRLLIARFKGCTSTGDRPPFVGYWFPDSGGDSGVDRSTNLMVYSRVSGNVDEFFGLLKTVLKEIGHQEEILIERADVWLTPAATTSTKRRRKQ